MKTMRYLLYAFILFLSCNSPQANFDWLVGSWERTNGKPGTQTIETWEKINTTTYKALALVLNNQDTVYKEICTIKKEKNEYYYIAEEPENPKPTPFKIVESTNESFKAVNPENEYPKVITYKFSKGKITATISGGGKQADYNFERRLTVN